MLAYPLSALFQVVCNVLWHVC